MIELRKEMEEKDKMILKWFKSYKIFKGEYILKNAQ